MSIWGEIKNDHIDNDVVYIDGYLTDDDNEAGRVIAKVNVRTQAIEYLDNRARKDCYAQDIINDVIDSL